MSNTYLSVPFKDKDAAKALGARWDAAQRQWYVPLGLDIAGFSAWLPTGSTLISTVALPVSNALATPLPSNTDLTVPKKGATLSSLLAGVSQAVTQAYRSGIWVLVEVVELRSNGGHVFMGISERDPNGTVLAKTTAVIWQSTANTILPEFERATGAQLAPGIKLLVRARPVFKPLHGFTLEIDGIDPQYTLGDLEARKREIREKLRLDGVYRHNKELPTPWDYTRVLVVAPEGAAGLGDFQGEADRLQHYGLCHFTYVFSRFQGEGAAREICDTLQSALAALSQEYDTQVQGPDAVVIIRGGGAVNDLAWLNDYDLARTICDFPIPVLVGIGHERDSTVLDEVAHLSFDTPSKVVAGIEQLIARRANEAKVFYDQITRSAGTSVQVVRAGVVELEREVQYEAQRHIAQGKQSTAMLLSDLRLDSMGAVRLAADQSREAFQSVKTHAATVTVQVRRDVPALWRETMIGAQHGLQAAKVRCDATLHQVLERGQRDTYLAKKSSIDTFDSAVAAARLIIKEGTARSQALMREIAGQGPDKTLKRGFALVRIHASNHPVTRAAQVMLGTALEIQFQDGVINAVTGDQHNREK